MNIKTKWLLILSIIFILAILNLDAGCDKSNEYQLLNMFTAGLLTGGLFITFIGYKIEKRDKEK